MKCKTKDKSAEQLKKTNKFITVNGTPVMLLTQALASISSDTWS